MCRFAEGLRASASSLPEAASRAVRAQARPCEAACPKARLACADRAHTASRRALCPPANPRTGATRPESSTPPGPRARVGAGAGVCRWSGRRQDRWRSSRRGGRIGHQCRPRRRSGRRNLRHPRPRPGRLPEGSAAAGAIHRGRIRYGWGEPSPRGGTARIRASEEDVVQARSLGFRGILLQCRVPAEERPVDLAFGVHRVALEHLRQHLLPFGG